MNFRNRLMLGFGTALCILLIIGALSYRKFLQEGVDQRWVAHTHQVLEAFSYSVSHDLRAPLRGIEGFSQALQEDYGQQLDGTALDYLRRIRAATHRMAELIDDLLDLARVTRAEMYREPINLSRLVFEVAQELQSHEPQREVALNIAEGRGAGGDARLVRVALKNLIGNAWKFT